MKVFLSAEWRNLINLTYRVPAEKLQPYLPQGLSLDLYEGHAHLSLVAFDFVNTRLKGVKVPFHVDFPEINLRFYVRLGDHRGVVFIKELVPKHCIAFVAKRFYNEPYESFPMESRHDTLADGRIRSHHQVWKEEHDYELETVVGADLHLPATDTAAHFFKEHDLGFGVDKKGATLVYAVEHPIWETRDIQELKLEFDFGKIYGEEWSFLNESKPRFSVFAAGSAIKVFHPMSIETWLLRQAAIDEDLLAQSITN
jgi:uncharacterized protein